MDLSSHIEHTLLKPNATAVQIKQLCEEAIEHDFVGVCVPPYHILTAKKALEGTTVKVVTVVGFPMGYSAISSKVEEAKRAVDDNADEVDMVVNISAVIDENWAHVRNDIDSVTRATHLKGKKMKIILETGLISKDAIRKLCDICMQIGVDYIKTSTGMNGPGVQLEDIHLIKSCIAGSPLKIKASGGIKTKEFAIQLINAGVSRLGTSSGLLLVQNETTISNES